MATTRLSIDENKGQVQYSIEYQFKDKQDFVEFISKFAQRAAQYSLAIQLVELPPQPTPKVDKL
jgi:hypothetical protein